MKAVQDGTVSAIVVWRLDRLGRTAKGLTAPFDDLRDRKVNLVSLRDGLDLATPAGRLMANVLAGRWPSMRPKSGPSGSSPARLSPGPRGSSSAAPWGPASRSRSPWSRRRRSAGSRPRARRSPLSPAPVGLSRPTIYSVLNRAAEDRDPLGRRPVRHLRLDLPLLGVRPARVEGRHARAGRGHCRAASVAIPDRPAPCPADRGPLDTLLCPPGQFVIWSWSRSGEQTWELLPGLGILLDTVAFPAMGPNIPEHPPAPSPAVRRAAA